MIEFPKWLRKYGYKTSILSIVLVNCRNRGKNEARKSTVSAWNTLITFRSLLRIVAAVTESFVDTGVTAILSCVGIVSFAPLKIWVKYFPIYFCVVAKKNEKKKNNKINSAPIFFLNFQGTFLIRHYAKRILWLKIYLEKINKRYVIPIVHIFKLTNLLIIVWMRYIWYLF